MLTQIYRHRLMCTAHLGTAVFHAAYESKVEASTKTVFEEDGGTTAVEAAL